MEAPEFIENVVTSGLVDREDLDRALAGFEQTARAKLIARHLVDAGKLTKFQAERLLAGKTDGFQLGQYRILDELGRGGMGRVFKAVHLAMGRFVALKMISPALTQTDRARELFQREVRAAGRLHHPNIVTFYDAHTSGDRCYLVMEFVDGPNLSQLVREQGPLPVEQACEYVRQAAQGLDYAHAQGLVHRDIKPSNLLVQQTPSGPQVKLLDFGLSLATAGDVNTPGKENTVLGTPDYVSPEQAKSQHTVDGRSDLYSLGCTFYYLLTGEPPFPGGTPLEKVIRHQSDAPVSVQTRRPDVPDAVSAIVHKLLAKNQKWRYQTAGELVSDLVAAAAGKKADWSAPPLPRPNLKKRRSDPERTPSTSDHPFEDVDLDDPSATSTLSAAMTSTRETATPPRRPRGKNKPMWPFIALAVVVAFSLVAGFGLLVRYLVGQVD
jgi:serine/threonine-protein kinase